MNILQTVKRLLKKRAALQAEITRIDAILAPLGSTGTGPARPTAAKVGRPAGRKMSAAAKAKIAAAAKARWKKAKAEGRTRL